MSEESSQTNIIVLSNSYEAFGLILDFLADTDPFSDFDLSTLAGVVRAQLRDSHHLAAMRDDQMVGYAGWLLTSTEMAEEWVEGRAILTPSKAAENTAAALTIFACSDPKVTLRLIRGARELNEGVRVFFKRGYEGTVRGSRKSSVLNFREN